jgi:hypothetical protein
MAVRSVLPRRQQQTTAHHVRRIPIHGNLADNASGCKRIFCCQRSYQPANRLSVTQLRREKISEVICAASRHVFTRIFPMFFRFIELRQKSSQSP